MGLFKNTPDWFNEGFLSWIRLEPRSRTVDFEQGLMAKTADPLWMLARQWQSGEFRGENCGSPLKVEVCCESSQVQLSFSNSPIPPPMETIVEAEPMPLTWRNRIRAGQMFEQLASIILETDEADELITIMRIKYPITNDDTSEDKETQRLLRFMYGRGIDGKELLELPDSTFQDIVNEAGFHIDVGRYTALKNSFLEWQKCVCFVPETSPDKFWREKNLDYQFEATVKNGMKLSAPSYRSGDSDWYTCDRNAEFTATELNPKPMICTPTRVGFGGMPHHRWWTFENAKVHFGNIDVATSDIARLMLMEFALVYGNDWMMVPLEVETSTVTRVSKLVVWDVFNDKTTISPVGVSGVDPTRRFGLFNLSKSDDTSTPLSDSVLFYPATVNHNEEIVLEEVRFVHDEGANMIWAVEHKVLDGFGNSRDAFELYGLENLRESIKINELPLYSLASNVPSNWIPYVPVNTGGDNRNILLRRAQMLPTHDASAVKDTAPRSLILKDGKLLWLNEEAILRAGLKLRTTVQRIRWTDGKTYVWYGKSIKTGPGEGNSSLKFDFVTDVDTSGGE